MTTEALQTSPEASAPSPLESTCFNLDIEGLLARLTVRQRYINRESIPIEAVFTFPMAMDATLLELQVVRNEHTLTGRVKARTSARLQYEEGVEAGHTAILLERSTADSYTANVGNLAPGESLELALTFGMLLRPREGALRLRIPTTIAPRYGASPYEPQAQPEVCLFAQHPFTLNMEIQGTLASASLSSPSHALRLKAAQNALHTQVTIDGPNARLDRDVVLDFGQLLGLESVAYSAPDGGGEALLTFVPSVPVGESTRLARDIVIMIDCSGSMAGDSIRLVREALNDVLPFLQESDRVQLLCFGNTVQPLFDALKFFDEQSRKQIIAHIASLDANLGGTELGKAMHHALDLLGTGPARSRSIFLLTDGQVNGQGLEFHAQQAIKMGITIHAIGIGAAAVESTIRDLTCGSGLADYVFPGDAMRHRIERAFMRVGGVRVDHFEFAVSPTPVWTALPVSACAGESLWLAARLDSRLGPSTGEMTSESPENHPTMIHIKANAEVCRVNLAVTVQPMQGRWKDELPRLAAALRLQESPYIEDSGVFAERYQLIADATACVLVDVATSSGGALPETRRVAQMLAAGWGGSGQMIGADTVNYSVFCGANLQRTIATNRESIPRRESHSTVMFSARSVPDFTTKEICRVCVTVAVTLAQQHRDANALRDAFFEKWNSQIKQLLPSALLARLLVAAGDDDESEELVALVMLTHALDTAEVETISGSYLARWRDKRALKRVRAMLAKGQDQKSSDKIKALIAHYDRR